MRVLSCEPVVRDTSCLDTTVIFIFPCTVLLQPAVDPTHGLSVPCVFPLPLIWTGYRVCFAGRDRGSRAGAHAYYYRGNERAFGGLMYPVGDIISTAACICTIDMILLTVLGTRSPDSIPTQLCSGRCALMCEQQKRTNLFAFWIVHCRTPSPFSSAGHTITTSRYTLGCCLPMATSTFSVFFAPQEACSALVEVLPGDVGRALSSLWRAIVFDSRVSVFCETLENKVNQEKCRSTYVGTP